MARVIIAGILAIGELAAATLPSLAVLSESPVTVIPMARPPAVFTENPPTLLSIPPLASEGCPVIPAASLAMYMSTGYVGLCVANVTSIVPNMTEPIGFPQTDTCSVPFSGESWRGWPPDDVPPHTEWLRNYHGVFGALPLHPGTADASLLILLHGEDKNELCWANDELYQVALSLVCVAGVCPPPLSLSVCREPSTSTSMRRPATVAFTMVPTLTASPPTTPLSAGRSFPSHPHPAMGYGPLATTAPWTSGRSCGPWQVT